MYYDTLFTSLRIYKKNKIKLCLILFYNFPIIQSLINQSLTSLIQQKNFLIFINNPIFLSLDNFLFIWFEVIQ